MVECLSTAQDDVPIVPRFVALSNKQVISDLLNKASSLRDPLAGWPANDVGQDAGGQKRQGDRNTL